MKSTDGNADSAEGLSQMWSFVGSSSVLFLGRFLRRFYRSCWGRRDRLKLLTKSINHTGERSSVGRAENRPRTAMRRNRNEARRPDHSRRSCGRARRQLLRASQSAEPPISDAMEPGAAGFFRSSHRSPFLHRNRRCLAARPRRPARG